MHYYILRSGIYMSIRIKKFSLQLVKEGSVPYDGSNKINKPLDAVDVFRALGLQNNAEEVLLMLTADTKNRVTGVFEVCRGSLNSSIVHPREVFKRAILNNASVIIIAHNHPSGDATPSQEDISITKRLAEVGKLIGIELLDHIILGDGKYTSLKDKGLL